MNNKILYDVKQECIQIHKEYGPGLLENAYHQILKIRLEKLGYKVESEVKCPIITEGIELPDAFRIDLLIDDTLIIELKTVNKLQPVHFKQLTTYMKLANKPIGLLVNFYCNDIFKEGLRSWELDQTNHKW